jgi:hypothetical protein
MAALSSSAALSLNGEWVWNGTLTLAFNTSTATSSTRRY